MSHLAGALLERSPGPRYAKSLSFAELRPGHPRPKVSTLAKWRRALPQEFQLGLRIPSRLWGTANQPLPDQEALSDHSKWIKEAAAAMAAAYVCIVTEARLTTGQRDRDRLRRFVDDLKGANVPQLVWHAGGLWERTPAAAFARQLDVVLAADANMIDSMGAPDTTTYAGPDAPFSYTLMRAEGARRAFSPAILADHAEQQLGGAASFSVFDSPKSFDEAKMLQQLFQAHT